MPRTPLIPALLCLPLLACAPAQPRAVDSLPPDAGDATRQLAEVKDATDGLPTPSTAGQSAVSPLIGRGYSQITGQPGATRNEKRLMAIRAARMEAMRDLAEQIHGLALEGQTSVQGSVVQTDVLTGRVAGLLRGARTRRVQPLGDDGYMVELEIDRDTVGYIVRVARGQ